ncbi:MAG TPA: DUF4113 domain-containing protein, partial [Synergistales bacterium]|nr:DUF4113 domain-containing protein [Synergistales bacterium]
AACLQRHLFAPMRDPREGALMGVMDRLNRELGKGTVSTASMGIHGRRSWVMRQERVSPRYTTRWEEIPAVLPPEGAP